jgi:hypothetical protein
MLLALGLVVGTAAAGATTASAVAADGRAEGLVLSFFELEGTHGYSFEGGELRKGTSAPTVSIAAQRKGLRAIYEVPGNPGPDVHAVFGSLGSVALDFHRRSARSTGRRRAAPG